MGNTMLCYCDNFFKKNMIGFAMTLRTYLLHVVLLIMYKDCILFTKFENRKILSNKMVYLFPRQEHLLINLIAYLKHLYETPSICSHNEF